MKVCGDCKKSLPESEFYFRDKVKGTLQHNCKSCRSKYHKEYYTKDKNKFSKNRKNNKLKYISRNKKIVTELLKNSECCMCGPQDYRCLEFHHREPSKKEHDISTLVHKGKAEEVLRAEIAKCSIICANCHKIYHSGIREPLQELKVNVS